MAHPEKSVLSSTIGSILFALVTLAPFEFVGILHSSKFDFVTYWTAAHLLANGRNPYDRAAIFQLEHAVGNRLPFPFIMRNPPWTLPLIAPLGHLGLHVAALLWAVLMLLLASLAILALTRDRPHSRLRAALFPPMLVAIMTGQLATVVLFSAGLFLSLRECRPLRAGVALSLSTIKPQLLLFVWPVLLADCIRRRDWRLPAGFLLGLAGLTGLSLWLDPQAWLQYRTAMLHESITVQYLPNLCADLRFYLLPGIPWIQLVPAVLGIPLALWLYLRRRWHWLEDGSLLVALSVLLSPYSWVYDVALFLPAVLRTRSSKIAEDLYLLWSLVTLILIFAAFSWASPILSPIALFWMAWLYIARRLVPPDAPAMQAPATAAVIHKCPASDRMESRLLADRASAMAIGP